MSDEANETLLALTADIVAAHVANNTVSVTDLPSLITQVHAALSGLGTPTAAPVVEQQPAVSVRSSIKPDYLVCLEDGKKLKMLKRYLMTRYGMTPDDYRAKWNLPKDYPMVAPAYAEQRRALAHSIGLGRKRSSASASAAPAATPAKRGRPKASGSEGAKRGRKAAPAN